MNYNSSLRGFKKLIKYKHTYKQIYLFLDAHGLAIVYNCSWLNKYAISVYDCRFICICIYYTPGHLEIIYIYIYI